MSKEIKHQIGQDKSIPIVKRASLLYERSASVRSLVNLIPIGGAIDYIATMPATRFHQERVEHFISEANLQLEKLEELPQLDEEFIHDLLFATIDEVKKTRSNEKIERFAQIFSGSLKAQHTWDDVELLIHLTADLNDNHIRILKTCSDSEGHSGGADKGGVMVSREMKSTAELPVLLHEFPDLEESRLKMHCNDLISRGLLMDIGIGRLSTGALEMLQISDLGYWYTDQIAEATYLDADSE